MCVFTDKKVGKTLAFVLVPAIAINTYVGARILSKNLNDKVNIKKEETSVVNIIAEQAVFYESESEIEITFEEKNVFEKLRDIFNASGCSIDEILGDCDINTELYASALYMKLKSYNIPDDIIKAELENIMLLGYSYTDIDEKQWKTMFNQLLNTISNRDNVLDYYYPLAKYIHYNECSLEHKSEYNDGRITCDSLQEKFNKNFCNVSYLEYVTDMVNASDDLELINSLNRIINSESDKEACLYELENIYQISLVPMCVSEDVWNSYFKNLLKTVSCYENVCEVYYKLACFVHMLNCDYEHSISEFDTIQCESNKYLLKNL